MANKEIRRYVMAGSVFGIALATGFVMQNGERIASALIGQEGTPTVDGAAPDALEAEPLPQVGDQALPVDPTPAPLATPTETDLAEQLPDASLEGTAETVADQNAFSDYGLSCEVMVEATVGIAAMVDLTLTAPCYGNSPVTIMHHGLKFTQATSKTGVLQVSIPALAEDAEFKLRLDTGAEAEAKVQVPAVSEFDRAGLQWQGATGLQVHAFEFGSTYEEPGHIWAGAAQTPKRADRQVGGFLTQLGTPGIPGGWTAEVYSFPTEGAKDTGVIRLNVEAEVTASTCGKDLRAEVLQSGFGGKTEPVELTVAASSCQAVGQFLVLKNVLRDLKIAQN